MASWAIFTALDVEIPMPEPDEASYRREIVGTDANGGYFLSATARVRWQFASDVDADGGQLTRAQWAALKSCIQADGTLTLRTKDDSEPTQWIKVRGRVEGIPGVTFVRDLPLGVVLVVNDCEGV